MKGGGECREAVGLSEGGVSHRGEPRGEETQETQWIESDWNLGINVKAMELRIQKKLVSYNDEFCFHGYFRKIKEHVREKE